MKKLNNKVPLAWWQLFILIALSGYAVGNLAAKFMNAFGG